MPDVDDERTPNAVTASDHEDDLAAAYEALDEDQRQQHERTAAPVEDASLQTADEGAGNPPSDVAAPNVAQAPDGDASSVAADAAQPTEAGVPPDASIKVASAPSRRVFVIDAKEYPDPDPDLPIAGPRSVQSLYRDYFPDQLNNADVAQKTRPDGTLEVTFKRRIGTKGLRARRRPAPGSGEVVITIPRVVRLLADLPADRPLAWELIEQAIEPTGAVRLDYVPPASQLNLAEAQQAARVRQIEQTVGELGRLRPTG